jgi:hypothetical protein
MEILIYGGPLEASEDWVRSEFADWHSRKPFVWFQGHGGIPWEPQTSTYLLRRPVFVDPDVDWFTTPLFDSTDKPIQHQRDALSAARGWLRDHPD